MSPGPVQPSNAAAQDDGAALEARVTALAAEHAATRAELAAARDELAELIRAVSHDLRAPVRRLQSFAEMLVATAGAGAPGEVAHLVARIRVASEQVGTLLDGLVELARLARHELVREQLDMTAATESIVAALRAREPHRAVQFVAAPGLAATADPALTRTLLEHLLANAWKFTARVDLARIQFGCEPGDGEAVFFVRDNGCGFDMTNVERLFQPFARLHSAKEFGGAGIGLAAVARIVRRHGGRVWAAATPGAGATFRFTLPTPG